MVVALNNGDMFKCNFQNTLYGIEYTDSETPKPTTSQNQNKTIDNSKQTGTQDPKEATGSAKQTGSGSNKDGNGADKKESENKEINGDRENKEETNEDEEDEDEPDLDNNKIYKPMLVPGVSLSLLDCLRWGGFPESCFESLLDAKSNFWFCHA